jgi:hypothetical protein
MRRSAEMIFEEKGFYSNGAIFQIRVWKLPKRTPERPHGLKYSLFYGRPGERIIGYDNETGKGDHRQYRNHQEVYIFRTFEQLLADFWRDVEKERSDG